MLRLGLVLTMAAMSASATGSPTVEAIRLADPVLIDALRDKGRSLPANERELLDGVAASYRLDDIRAVRHLRHALTDGSLSPALARAGWMALGATEMRRGSYAAAAIAFGKASPLADAEPALTAGDKQALRQSTAVAAALRDAPPSKRLRFKAGTIPLSRDAAGLARASLLIDGKPQSAILDTGANLSVIMRSRAEALGLRFTGPAISVASPTSANTSAHLAVADRLVIGDAEFANVVFLVFADADLTFANGAYKIEAILGFPVLSQLERLTFASDGGRETLAYGPASGRPDAKSDLFVDGLTPKLLLAAKGTSRPLIFALDSGADQTALRPRFAADFPQAMTGATGARLSLGGAGATVGRDARQLNGVVIEVDGRPYPLGPISLYPEELSDAGSHGRVGQDLLRVGRGYVLDFRRMDFQVLPKRD